MPISEDQVNAGQAVYTPGMLSIYDLLVLGISNRFIWKCPSPVIGAHYNAHLSANHLDVGVGTGYFLDRCHFPTGHPRIALMDMNPNTLAFASGRIARTRPETHEQNVFQPISTPIEPFDSVGINYLLHCLPGSLNDKAVAFDHLKTLMNPGCRVFGSTILHRGVRRSWTARRLMAFYNGKGVFSNTNDDLAGLQEALSQRFAGVSIKVVGCVALFAARTA